MYKNLKKIKLNTLPNSEDEREVLTSFKWNVLEEKYYHIIDNFDVLFHYQNDRWQHHRILLIASIS